MHNLQKLSAKFAVLCFLSAGLVIGQPSFFVSAHSGGLDSNGGHAGSQPYHCHRSPCELPSKTPDTATPASGGSASGIQILSVSPHCFDEFDELETIYVTEGTKPCKIKVRVTGRGAVKSRIVLQVNDEYDDWIQYSVIKETGNNGQAVFAVSLTSSEGCYEGELFDFRFAVAKTGKFKALKSQTFAMAFVSDENSPSCNSGDDD